MQQEAAMTLTNAEKIAFEDIFKQYYPLVYNIAKRTLGSKEEAEEVAQDTFIKLYERWPRIIITTSLTAWLARVCLNIAFNKLRSKKQFLKSITKLEELHKTADSAENQAIANEDHQTVQKILLQLKPKERACLITRHSGLSYQEISDTVGIRLTSVGKTLSRAEAKFKKSYQKLMR